MQEQLISIETAKLAKKANFYLDRTLVFSKEDGNGTMYFGNNTIDSDEEVKRKYLSGEFTDFEGNPVYLIVTQSLLQKWLREVHGINVYCTPTEIDETKWYHNIASSFKVYTGTYEQVLEKGLKEALKLINTNGK